MLQIINKIDKIFFRIPGLYKVWLRIRVGEIGKRSMVKKPELITEPEKIFIGENSVILGHSRIQSFGYRTKNENRIVIGNGCYIGYYLSILAGADIIIHDNVLIASFVLITSENHGIDPESTIPYMDQGLICNTVEIGEGSWIGEKASIMSGIKIGKKCIIGANAVVTHDVPDYSIVAGNPARVVKKYNFKEKKWVRI